jgi:hypothetical protein
MDLKGFTASGINPTSSGRAQAPVRSGLGMVGDALRGISLEIAARQDDDDYHAGVLSYAKGLNALDEEFDKDTDLATLSSRRAERVKVLADTTFEGKSHRVQEKLREKFDLAAETDAVKWKSIVLKKDAANRVAKFHEDTDVYQNQMIQAKTDEEFAKAKALWEGRLAAIQPYMSTVEFSNLRDRSRDQVKFKRAWSSLTGEGEFDPKPYMDLNPDQVSQLEGRHHALARERERKVVEHQVDRINVLMPRLEDSLASAMQEGVPMDGTEDMLKELAGLGERGAAMESRYRAQLGRAARVRDTLDAVKHQTFPDQMQAVETLKPEPGAENYRADMEMYQRAGQRVMQDAKAFQADPAGFVREEAEQRAQMALDPWVEDADRERFVVHASMDLQRERGAVEPKVLSTGQAKGLKDQYERADGDGKAELLTSISATYGDMDQKALDEMGLDDANAYGAELYMDDELLGRKVLQALSFKEDDITVSPEERKTIKQDAQAAFFDGPGEYFQKQYELTMNPRYQEMSRNLLSAAIKYGLVVGDGAKAVKEMWGNKLDTVITDKMQVMVPKDVDAEDLEMRLKNWTWHSLSYDNPFSKYGTWVTSSDRAGFVLSLPTGEVMKDAEGKQVVVTYDDLNAMELNLEKRELERDKHRMTRSEVEWL